MERNKKIWKGQKYYKREWANTAIKMKWSNKKKDEKDEVLFKCP